MVVQKLKLLHDGFFQIDLGLLLYLKTSCYGQKYNAAVKSLLVRTDEDNVLIDTGIGELPTNLRKIYRIDKPTTDLIKSLRKEKLKPKDITIVINTHLHLDHSGYNRVFKNARFFCQRKELEYFRKPDFFMKSGYVKDCIEGLDFGELDGDAQIVDGVKVICTPGHTPGHQSVVIDYCDKTYVYCGDIAPLRQNLEKRIIVGILHNPVDAMRSLDRLRQMKAHFIFCHDNKQMEI